jgi:hypothetical protein
VISGGTVVAALIARAAHPDRERLVHNDASAKCRKVSNPAKRIKSSYTQNT